MKKLFLLLLALILLSCVIGQLQLTPVIGGRNNQVEFDNDKTCKRIFPEDCRDDESRQSMRRGFSRGRHRFLPDPSYYPAPKLPN